MSGILRGKVLWFKGNFGFIDSGGTHFFVHYTSIITEMYPALYPEEDVEFEEDTSARNPRAKNVRSLAVYPTFTIVPGMRLQGAVRQFSHLRGFGYIVAEDERFFFSRAFVRTPGKQIKEGDRVEFSPEPGPPGKTPIATKILHVC